MIKPYAIALLGLLSSTASMAKPDHIFLLRHAEKAAGQNPSLTAQGQLRANAIAKQLSPWQPNHLFSSNYKRTQETLAPLAKLTNQEVSIYNARELSVFAAELLEHNGVVVVAGHSNTTPELLAELSGYKVMIAEDEFHKLFELRLHNGEYRLIRHQSKSE